MHTSASPQPAHLSASQPEESKPPELKGAWNMKLVPASMTPWDKVKPLVTTGVKQKRHTAWGTFCMVGEQAWPAITSKRCSFPEQVQEGTFKYMQRPCLEVKSYQPHKERKLRPAENSAEPQSSHTHQCLNIHQCHSHSINYSIKMCSYVQPGPTDLIQNGVSNEVSHNRTLKFSFTSALYMICWTDISTVFNHSVIQPMHCINVWNKSCYSMLKEKKNELVE